MDAGSRLSPPRPGIDPHPLLDLAVVSCRFPRPLGECATPEPVSRLLALEGFPPELTPPLDRSDETKAAVRRLLRHGGFKPSGRNKPASEYLIKAAASDRLQPINLAVDVCNVVSLHSGLPISVVDLDRLEGAPRLVIAPADTRHVFNASGQEIDVGGLICLFDSIGPCANPVKDSQRTKTHPGSQRCLSLVWGTRALPGRTRAALGWYRELLTRLGARCEDVACVAS